jgi:hypothetical protein
MSNTTIVDRIYREVTIKALILVGMIYSRFSRLIILK